MNGGSNFTPNEAVSFQVFTDDQAETDRYWTAIVDGGGRESACGWCKARCGLSWQIGPERLFELINDPDPVRATAATKAMLGMRKIVITELEDAVGS